MSFYLIAWKEFNNRKMLEKANIVKSDNIPADLENLQNMNAQKRLTTTDYHLFNLSDLFKDQGLEIVESVKTDTPNIKAEEEVEEGIESEESKAAEAKEEEVVAEDPKNEPDSEEKVSESD